MVRGLALAGTPTLDATARRLGTSPRTLQRRLNGMGTGFREVVEQSRFEIAGALLRETDLKVQEIAARLGYRTPGSFARAFGRCAGCSPRAFRTAAANRQFASSDWREMGRSAARPGVISDIEHDMPEES